MSRFCGKVSSCGCRLNRYWRAPWNARSCACSWSKHRWERRIWTKEMDSLGCSSPHINGDEVGWGCAGTRISWPSYAYELNLKPCRSWNRVDDIRREDFPLPFFTSAYQEIWFACCTWSPIWTTMKVRRSNAHEIIFFPVLDQLLYGSNED